MEYTIRFNLNAKFIFNYQKSSCEGISGHNAIELTEETRKQNDEDVIGYVPTKYLKRNIIVITLNNMRDTISIDHEIAHTLGAEHKDEGLMVKSRQLDHQTYLTQENINEIVYFLIKINEK